MARQHPSTPGQRARWVGRLIAQGGAYGLVTLLGREAGASRQALYGWKARGLRALEQAFAPVAAGPDGPGDLARAVLTLLVEAHPSERGIQACLGALCGRRVSLGAISAIIGEAQRRALAWMASHAPPGARPVALDGIYGHDRRGAYLSLVDAESYAVWAAEGPLAVDAESWTLLLWLAQERGLRWRATASDGGAAIESALRAVDPQGQHARDVWHVLHRCGQAQARLERYRAQLAARTAAAGRQVARLTAGQRARGRPPRAAVGAQGVELARAGALADGLRYLSAILRELLGVVVLTPRGLLDRAGRERELGALLELLAELAGGAPAGPRAELERLHGHLSGALPGLLAFVPALEPVERGAAAALGREAVALLAWAWQRRAILGPAPDALAAQLPEGWRPAARALLGAWGAALRASGAAETWHSVLRPHLAVHRRLSPGLLALLAVWHNHRAFARGAHAGRSPLRLSGLPEAPTDWLVALGYPPAAAPAAPPRPLPAGPTRARELAA